MQAHSISFTSKAYESQKRAKSNASPNFSVSKEDKSKKVALAALVGATLPIIVINALKKGKINEISDAFKNKLPVKNKLKSIWKLFEIKNLGHVFATTTGAVLMGTLAGTHGVKSKNEKRAKYKEGVFQFANSMLPATFVTLGLSGLKKTSKAGSKLAKTCVVISSLVAGMFAANRVSNKINNKVFDKAHNGSEKRSFKLKDTISQFDDLGYIAVLSGLPIVSKLQIDKFLPIMYAKMGYEAGNAQKNKAA